MSYLVVILFILNNQMTSMYLGEVKTEQECVRTALATMKTIAPEIKNGYLLCVKKVET